MDLNNKREVVVTCRNMLATYMTDMRLVRMFGGRLSSEEVEKENQKDLDLIAAFDNILKEDVLKEEFAKDPSPKPMPLCSKCGCADSSLRFSDKKDDMAYFCNNCGEEKG